MNTVSASYAGYSTEKSSIQTQSISKNDNPDSAEDAVVNDVESKSISLPSAQDAQRVFNQRILATVSEQIEVINEYLELSGAEPIESLVPDDFTPEKVAERILSFITAGIAGLDAEDPARASLLEAARSGFEKGYAEAKEILVGLGVFAGDVLENAEKTYVLIQQGLDKLEGILDSSDAVEV